MNPWVLGERRHVYAVISAALGSDPVISEANYEVFNVLSESVVASGEAIISNQILYFLWEPPEVSVYVARINYVVGTEWYKSNQVIEVRETM